MGSVLLLLFYYGLLSLLINALIQARKLKDEEVEEMMNGLDAENRIWV